MIPWGSFKMWGVFKSLWKIRSVKENCMGLNNFLHIRSAFNCIFCERIYVFAYDVQQASKRVRFAVVTCVSLLHGTECDPSLALLPQLHDVCSPSLPGWLEVTYSWGMNQKQTRSHFVYLCHFMSNLKSYLSFYFCA